MFKKMRNFVAGAVVAATPLLTLVLPSVAHAATYTCTWTGATSSSFTDATNWSGCNGSSPQTADTNNLVFPLAVTNDTLTIPAGYTFNTITFNGSGSGYNFGGSSFTLAGGVTDTSSSSNVFSNNIVLSGINTFDISSGLMLSGVVSGTGSVVKAGTGYVQMDTAGPTFTGSVTVNAGSVSIAAGSASPSFSSLTIADNATFNFDPFKLSGPGTTYTMNTPITVGAAGLLKISSGNIFLAGVPHAVDLTGTFTLTGNAYLSAGKDITVHIKGPLVGPGFVLTASGTGVVSNESSSNTTNTPSGVLAVTTGQQGAAPDVPAAPAAPDTGSAFVSSNPGVTFAITLATAGAIFAAARMSRKTANRN